MTQKKPSHADDITMSRGGLYSLATKGAKDVIDQATPFALDALAKIDLEGPGPFSFADMGCADGGTSLGLVQRLLGAVRSAAPRREVQVTYLDQPGNDYNALIRIIHGLTEFKTYLDDFDGVFVAASGTSFYRQGLPSSSLHLGFSATAMHWLSRKPGDISDHVQAVGAQGEERERFRAQSEADWEAILLCRARELVPGGWFVFVNFCVDEQGRCLGNTGGVNMFDTFRDLWRRFVDDGVITANEYATMTLPQYYRTVEEFRAPFDDKASAVSRAGLRLHRIETRIVPCPFAAEYREHGDAARFAAEYIPTLRTWTESTYFGALSVQRPLEERQRIIDHYYRAYQAMVESEPKGHAMDYVHAYMVTSKHEMVPRP